MSASFEDVGQSQHPTTSSVHDLAGLDMASSSFNTKRSEAMFEPHDDNDPSFDPHSANQLSGENGEFPREEQMQNVAYQSRPVKLTISSIRHRLESYFQEPSHSEGSWTSLPEIPGPEEVAGIVDGKVVNTEVLLSPIRLDEPWPNVQEYLKNYYTLMREDCVSTLTDVVWEQRSSFNQMEDNSQKNARIYERVYISGLCVTAEGIAHLLDFSTGRAKKKVLWTSSRRLKPGTLVALTPVQDQFQTRCLVAVVAARPLSLLENEVPSVYVYFRDAEQMEIDTQVEYLMVEASNGYFEACRHTLKALQHMVHEDFPLSEHLVHLEKGVQTAKSLEEDSHMNIDAALVAPINTGLPDVLLGWPEVEHVNTSSDKKYHWEEGTPFEESRSSEPEETPENLQRSSPATFLDASQFEALRRVLTKRLAIVQGPPGTGKTHVSVVALRILLDNKKRGSPPIIITAQTNHALDQLLRHISPYAPEFIRLGGQTNDKDTIEPRTLFRVKERDEKKHKDLRKHLHAMRNSINSSVREMRELLRPLANEEPVDPKLFLQNRLITRDQYESLIRSDETWVGDTIEGGGHAILTWSNDHVRPFKRKPLRARDDMESSLDNDDDLNDAILEQGVFDRDKDEPLRGPKITLSRGFASANGFYDSHRQIKDLLETQQDLYKVPRAARGPMYAWLQAQYKLKVRDRIRELAESLKRQQQDIKIARMTLDAAFLIDAPIIGTTTTGLSKYRGLLNSIQPKVVLIEEAAETQEAYVTAACFETLDQLILVGDHQQLRAHCQNKDLEDYNLHYSLFERLVQFGGIEFQQLNMQRRMLPEMREVLNVIYPNLTDHPTVHGRLDIPGMGGRNTWCMTHETPETIDDHFSYLNGEEAYMVAHFYYYLVRNGTPRRNITILTFYNGQKRRILSLLRSLDTNIPEGVPNVFTVDSYQGEENEVVILSLVRSNPEKRIGFLSVQNRVCVALSRARRGFYMFGDIRLIYRVNETWNKIIRVYHPEDEQRIRFGKHLPLVCQNHGRKIEIRSSADWGDNSGGCDQPCGETLKCGHVCPRYCHPQPHEYLPCMLRCPKTLPCGHRCVRLCNQQQCHCEECDRVYRATLKEIRKKKEARRAGRTGRATRPDFLPSDESDEEEVVLDGRLIHLDDSDEVVGATGPGDTGIPQTQTEKPPGSSDDTGILAADEKESSGSDKPEVAKETPRRGKAREMPAGLWIGAPTYEAPGNMPLPERRPTSQRPSKKEQEAGVRSYQEFARGSFADGDRRAKEAAYKERQRKKILPGPQRRRKSESPATKATGNGYGKPASATTKGSGNTTTSSQTLSEKPLPVRIKRTENWAPTKPSKETEPNLEEMEGSKSNSESIEAFDTTKISTKTQPTEEELQEEYGTSYDLIDIS